MRLGGKEGGGFEPFGCRSSCGSRGGDPDPILMCWQASLPVDGTTPGLRNSTMAHMGGHSMQTGLDEKEVNNGGTPGGTLTNSVYKSMWETRASRTDVGHKLGDGRISHGPPVAAVAVLRYVSQRDRVSQASSDRKSSMAGNVDRDPGGTWEAHRAGPGYLPRYLDQQRNR